VRRLLGVLIVLVSAVAVPGIAFPVVAFAAPQPTDWCGPGESAVDLPDTVGGPQVHVIYAYPADAPDNFGRWVTPIARDLAAVDSWWQGQDPTRTLRFDFASFPGCASQFGALDISSVRLPNASDHYLIDEPDVIDVLNQELSASFPSIAKKYLVYFDGPVRSSAVCGRGASGPLAGASAVLYLQSEAACMRAGGGPGAPGGAFSAALAVHELIHTLDDGPTTGPHKCPEGGRHYCDDPNDILAPSATAATRLATSILDSGRDDYYGTGGSSDVRNSPFLVHLDGATVRLAVAVATPGGRVTSDVPGVVCPGVCELPWDAGSIVRLTAQPDPGYGFAGWDGACTDTVPSCAVTLASDTTVTARFGATGTLSVRVVGRGAVDQCASRCTRAIVAGQELTLTASPRAGSRFIRWEGACRGRARECTVTLEPGATVRAVFES
jgi:Divergent InlB B-repeat domain